MLIRHVEPVMLEMQRAGLFEHEHVHAGLSTCLSGLEQFLPDLTKKQWRVQMHRLLGVSRCLSLWLAGKIFAKMFK